MIRKFVPGIFLAGCLTLPFAAFAQDSDHGVQVQNMDKAVKPGDDFYMYANGGWIARTELPADRAGLGVFTQLDERARKNTAAIIKEEAAKKGAPGTESQQIADAYTSYMDEAAIEARGMQPIEPLLKKIAAIRTKKELATALGETLRNDVDALNNTNFHTQNLFGLWVAGGFNDPDHNAAYIMQGGAVLPTRDYYLDNSERMKDLRAKYQAHVAAMLKLAGFTDTDARAAKIVALETDIAKTHRSLEENEDIHKANNVWTMADFATKAPGLDWKEYFDAAGLGRQKSFIVWQPEAFTGESALVASQPLDTWKDWLAFHWIEGMAGALPKVFVDERFAFFGTALSGVKQQRPREQRAIAFTGGIMGDAIGKIYAQKYFSPQAKAEAQAMVANIIEAFDQRLANNTWMAASTKEEARKKLKTLYVGIGYPETWKDYSGLVIKGDDLYGNIWRASEWSYKRDLAKIGTPVNRHEWSMTPQTVNAVNLPLQNALNFPAAILQPPFFDPEAPASTNYGAIGSIIGHEVSHTFDTEGSTFDSQGKVRNWWTDADLDHFHKATAALAAQYDTYMPFPDLHVNGKQTLAENIADNGGLAASYDAWKASLKGQPAPENNGFNGDQQFYLGFAQAWGQKERPGALRQQVMTDPHAPAQYRADEVRNYDAWYAAFNVQPGDKLYLAPDARVRVW